MNPTSTQHGTPQSLIRLDLHLHYQLLCFFHLPRSPKQIHHASIMLQSRPQMKLHSHHSKILLPFLNQPSMATRGEKRCKSEFIRLLPFFHHPLKQPKHLPKHPMNTITRHQSRPRHLIPLRHSIKHLPCNTQIPAFAIHGNQSIQTRQICREAINQKSPMNLAAKAQGGEAGT
uniref:Uncharacterized protein n=1 Tax=Cucumis sativus TaxID=3659 RepID=A0A0A0K6R1_CUCSA